MLDVEASSPSTVIVDPACVTFIPSPPRIENEWLDGVIAPLSVVTVLTTVALRSTAPAVTSKSSVLKEAIPLLVVLASSPATVITLPVCVTSTPSPPKIEIALPDGVIAPPSVVTLETTEPSTAIVVVPAASSYVTSIRLPATT